MRHKVQDLDKRRVLLAGAGCALILCLALYLYFGRSVNKEKRVNHAAPLVKVQQVVRQDMIVILRFPVRQYQMPIFR